MKICNYEVFHGADRGRPTDFLIGRLRVHLLTITLPMKILLSDGFAVKLVAVVEVYP